MGITPEERKAREHTGDMGMGEEALSRGDVTGLPRGGSLGSPTLKGSSSLGGLWAPGLSCSWPSGAGCSFIGSAQPAGSKWLKNACLGCA